MVGLESDGLLPLHDCREPPIRRVLNPIQCPGLLLNMHIKSLTIGILLFIPHIFTYSMDLVLINRRPRFNPRDGKIPGEGNGNPLQYSYLENPMDRRTWWAMKSQRDRHD